MSQLSKSLLSGPVPPSVPTSFVGDSGTAIPSTNVLNIRGNPDIEVVGSGNTLQMTDLVKWTPYVVDSNPGAAPYQTIQSAINAAQLNTQNTIVLVRPGLTSTYTENLVFTTGTVDVLGAVALGDSSQLVINGIHTPPSSGHLVFRNFQMASATDIFNSSAAGTSGLVFIDCAMNLTNGYTFNLPNWTGFFECFDIGEQSAINGVVNNTGGAAIFFFAASLGAGTSKTMTTSGLVRMDGVDIFSPTNFSTGTILSQLDRCTFNQAVTFSGNSTGIFNDSRVVGGSSAALTMSSSAGITCTNCVLNSANNPCIAGSGSGTLTLGNITFINNALISGSLTISGSSTFLVGGTLNLTAAGPQVLTGSGAPGISAPKGSLYINTTASTTTSRLYINTTGSTTWAFFTTSA